MLLELCLPKIAGLRKLDGPLRFRRPDVANPAEHYGACVPRLRCPHRPRRMGRGLPRPLRDRITAHRARVLAPRTMAIWPIAFVHEVEPLGTVSNLVELVTVLVLVSLLHSDRASRPQPVPIASPSDR